MTSPGARPATTRDSANLLNSDAARLVAGLAAVGAVTAALGWLRVSNSATASTMYLMVVLVVAASSRLWVAGATSITAMLCLNFFFLPPVGTLTIADPQNWVALFAFLAVSLVASNLSAVARARADEALGRRNELARLFDLSRDVLQMTESREALSVLARSIARRFDLEFVAIALPREGEWDVYEAGGQSIAIDRRELSSAFAAAQATLEFDAYARTYAGHRTTTVDGHLIRLVPLRVGTKPIGVIAAAGRPVEPGTLDTLAGVVAIAIERAQFLDERKAGELTRQSEQLKTALLASLSHDLRTPLTAIRIAASNIKASEVAREERIEQSDLILSEVERLTRLFQNLLEMARIDAGGIAAESRWAHPSEIVAAARDQVEQALQGHRVDVTIEPDIPVRLDPRLTATALAHLLENAAQYSPAGSVVNVIGRVGPDGLAIQVRDHGPGIAPADLPHLFKRFYRGAAAKSRTSGTGMGLWIARGLLAVQNGQVWAENCADGGAQFTLVVPGAAQESTSPTSPQ
jgi:two-component system, OmpR family, sensor histidine kinase KdpD